MDFIAICADKTVALKKNVMRFCVEVPELMYLWSSCVCSPGQGHLVQILNDLKLKNRRFWRDQETGEPQGLAGSGYLSPALQGQVQDGTTYLDLRPHDPKMCSPAAVEVRNGGR